MHFFHTSEYIEALNKIKKEKVAVLYICECVWHTICLEHSFDKDISYWNCSELHYRLLRVAMGTKPCPL